MCAAFGGRTYAARIKLPGTVTITEDCILAEYDAKKLEKAGWECELTFQYTDDEDLERQIYDLSAEMSHEADLRNGFVECRFLRLGLTAHGDALKVYRFGGSSTGPIIHGPTPANASCFSNVRFIQ